MDSDDPVLRMRCADVLEKVTAQHPPRPTVTRHITALTETGTAAMKARGKKLLARLAKQFP